MHPRRFRHVRLPSRQLRQPVDESVREGDRVPEAYRQSHRRMVSESSGRNESERRKAGPRLPARGVSTGPHEYSAVFQGGTIMRDVSGAGEEADRASFARAVEGPLLVARPGMCVDEDHSALQIFRASEEAFEACFQCRNLGGDESMKPPPGAAGQTEFKFIGLDEIDERRLPLTPTVPDRGLKGAFFDVASHDNTEYRLRVDDCVLPADAPPPCPRDFRCSAANGPNSSSRVFSGCRSSRNFRERSARSVQNRSASDLFWNPSTMSSANLTTMTSPVACVRRHAWAQRSNT